MDYIARLIVQYNVHPGLPIYIENYFWPELIPKLCTSTNSDQESSAYQLNVENTFILYSVMTIVKRGLYCTIATIAIRGKYCTIATIAIRGKYCTLK